MSYASKAKDSFNTKMSIFIYDLVSHDKNEFTIQEFQDYSIKPDVVNEYTTIYWQERVEYVIRMNSIKQIESKIKVFLERHGKLIKECEEHYVKVVFPKIFPFAEFDKLTKQTRCFYCGVTTELIEKLAGRRLLRKKNLRGWSMEIDRLDSSYEYSMGNCVMCCYWCNNAKTDEFTPTEFKYIGQLIGNVWTNRMNRNSIHHPGSVKGNS